MGYSIEMLPADDGDCLWIEYGNDTGCQRILIDGGRLCAYKHLISKLKKIPADIELLVLTHIDADHLEGAIQLLLDDPMATQINEVWYNGFLHLKASGRNPDSILRGVSKDAFGYQADHDYRSPQQGEYISALICDRFDKNTWNTATKGLPIYVPQDGPLPSHILSGGMKLTLLSPSRSALGKLCALWEKNIKRKHMTPGDTSAWLDAVEKLKHNGLAAVDPNKLHRGIAENPDSGDASAANGSSIAFLAEYDSKSALFLGDAHAGQIEQSVKRLISMQRKPKLVVDALKLSHHGSAKNITPALVELIDATHILISTSGRGHQHPDMETFELIVKHSSVKNMTFHFNYLSGCRSEIVDLLKQNGHMVACPPNDQPGRILNLSLSARH